MSTETRPAGARPDYLDRGDARRAARHEHWHGHPCGKQITIRDDDGRKVAVVPIAANGRPDDYVTASDAEADRALRRAKLHVAAPELERALWAALSGRDGWQAEASAVLRSTGFLPPEVAR